MSFLSKHFMVRGLMCLALGLLVFGARCGMIDSCGTDVPFYDQWDAEGSWLLKPWVEGELEWQSLFAPHNEHRVFWTRLVTLVAYEINGQWDGRLEAVISAGVLTLAVVLLFYCFEGAFAGWRKLLLWGGLAVLFSLPYSLFNTVNGFQSQFYFLMFFSLLHLWGSLHSRLGSGSWIMGQLAGVAAVFSMSSGLLSSVAVALVLIYRMVLERRWNRELLWRLAAVFLVGMVGVLAFHSVEPHQSLRAASFGQFIDSLMHLLAWPGKSIWSALLLVLPVVLLLLPPGKNSKCAEPLWLFLLGFGLWIGAQLAAISYARGGSNFGFSERYADLFGLYCLAGFVALNYLSLRGWKWSRMTWMAAAYSGLWLVIVGPGLYRQSYYQNWQLLSAKHQNNEQFRNIRNFMASDDSAVFDGVSPLHISYPFVGRFVELLRDSTMKSLLPVSIRPCLKLTEDAGLTIGIVRGGIPKDLAGEHGQDYWGTYRADDEAMTGEFQSEVMESRLPMVQLHIAGDFDEATLPVRIESLDGEEVRLPMIDHSPGMRIKSVNCFLPKGRFVLRIIDEDPDHWIAVGCLREMGLWSWLARWVVKSGTIMMYCGGGLFLLAGGLSWTNWRR